MEEKFLNSYFEFLCEIWYIIFEVMQKTWYDLQAAVVLYFFSSNRFCLAMLSSQLTFYVHRWVVYFEVLIRIQSRNFKLEFRKFQKIVMILFLQIRDQLQNIFKQKMSFSLNPSLTLFLYLLFKNVRKLLRSRMIKGLSNSVSFDFLNSFYVDLFPTIRAG